MAIDIEKLYAAADLSLRDTMAVIEEGAIAIALVVDENKKLVGTVTDGDIRRAILAGGTLEDKVSSIMNAAPLTVTPATDPQESRRIFFEAKVKHIPVVDDEGRVLKILLVNDLLSVPLSNPDITDSEREAVLEVLQTEHLSLGPKGVEFERKIAEYAGRKHAIAVNSGTSGLHLIVKSMGLGPGDEVITTPFSFIASSNCLLFEDATPVFADIDPHTYNIDPKKVEAAVTPKTKAILAVDVFGQPADYDALGKIAKRHNLRIISDSCESIGAQFQGKRAGSFGDAGVFAFYPNKQITTGEGGVVVTDDDEIARLSRSYRNQGRAENGGWLCHERLGYNYRLSDISCALGIAQLERVEEILQKRQRVAETYLSALEGDPRLIPQKILPGVDKMSWFVFVVRLADEYTREDRDHALHELRHQGIGANSYFQPIHLQPFYRERFGFKPGDFPVTEFASERTIALPFHNHLTEETARSIIGRLKGILEKRRPDVLAGAAAAG